MKLSETDQANIPPVQKYTIKSHKNECVDICNQENHSHQQIV